MVKAESAQLLRSGARFVRRGAGAPLKATSAFWRILARARATPGLMSGRRFWSSSSSRRSLRFSRISWSTSVPRRRTRSSPLDGPARLSGMRRAYMAASGGYRRPMATRACGSPMSRYLGKLFSLSRDGLGQEVWHPRRAQHAFKSFARQFMGWVRFAAYVPHDAVAAPAPVSHLMDGRSECLAAGGPASHHWGAVGSDDDSVKGPAMSGQIERRRTDLSLQLGRTAFMCEAERLCVEGPPSNENGQATSGPAVLVQSGVHVHDEALSQAALPPRRKLRRLASWPPTITTTRPRHQRQPQHMVPCCYMLDALGGVSRLNPRWRSAWSAGASPAALPPISSRVEAPVSGSSSARRSEAR